MAAATELQNSFSIQSKNVSRDDEFLEFVRQFFQYFGSYVSFVVLVVGGIGNVLSIVIFIRRRKQDKASAQYLGTLAVVDLGNTCVALNLWVHMNIHYVTNGQIYMSRVTTSALGCQIYLHLWNTFTFMSAYIVVCFSMERCLVIWFPLRLSAILGSSKPRKILLCSLTLASFILFSYNYWWTTLRSVVPGNNVEQICTNQADATKAEVIVYYFMLIGINTMIPCCLITVVNISILIGIHRSKIGSAKHSAKDSKNEMRCVRNLVAVSSFYFIFNAPAAITWPIYLSNVEMGFVGYSADAIRTMGELALFTTSLTYLNYGINPLVYTLSLDFYRKECKTILCICTGKKRIAVKTQQRGRFT